MNFDSKTLEILESLFTNFKTAQNKFSSVKEELGKIKQEINDYLSGAEDWSTKNNLPNIGDRILTGEVIGTEEKYRVLVYDNPDQLYKFWVKINPLPLT